MEVCLTAAAARRKLVVLSFSLLLSDIWAQKNTDVIKGQMVVLKATYSANSDPSNHIITWTFVTNKTQPIISYSKDSTSINNSQFKGRVGFVSQMPSSDVSLYINNTREADSGRYFWQVIVPDQETVFGELNLDVKVPPSVPECSMSGKPVLKGNVTLSCKSSSGKPVPLYRWQKTSPTSEVFFSPTLNEKTGALKLSNLSSNMSGKYMCTASNSAGSETCFINLEIAASNRVGVIVGATVGSVLGFIFLVLLLCVATFFFRRQRYHEDDMANEIKEDAQAPKRVSWAKSGLGSDIISKNGTLSSIASSPHHKEPSHHHNSHHHHLQQYPQRPPSDTASIITATGSTAGYRPSRAPGAATPTHYSYSNNNTLQRTHPITTEASASDSTLPERYTPLPQAQALPQTYGQTQLQLQRTPSPPPLPTSTVTPSNIARMGGVPIMVPAQNQAGSLV
ncbi:endothelial cell adhesion molecule a [Pholidichthys leucotaenia]